MMSHPKTYMRVRARGLILCVHLQADTELVNQGRYWQTLQGFHPAEIPYYYYRGHVNRGGSRIFERGVHPRSPSKKEGGGGSRRGSNLGPMLKSLHSGPKRGVRTAWIRLCVKVHAYLRCLLCCFYIYTCIYITQYSELRMVYILTRTC